MNKHFKWIFGILIIASVFGFIGCPKEPEINIYTVTFNANGGILTSNAEQHILAGGKIINPSAPTRDGYSFTGWYTNQNCTIPFDINNSFVNNSFTLYAGWIQNTYTVTFNPNNDNNSSSFDQIVNGGDKILTQILPYWDGYSFTGWYTDKECTIPYDFNQPIISSFTLYAGWIQNTYTVTFNPNGGTLTSEAEQLVLSGNKIVIPTPPTREGYNFTGWYCDEYCSYPYNFDAILKSDATLYAGWTQNTYTVIFNSNGGIFEEGNSINKILSVLSGNIITPPDDPINSFCSFTGWYTDIECTIPYDFTRPIMSSFTLYAGWELTTYTVTFNANGGALTGNTTQTVTSGSKIKEPTNPTHDEYDFTGWYTDIDCTNKYDFTNQVTSNFTLYAGWEIKNYTVSFNANGGTLTSNTSQTVSSGSKITEPSIPTRTGYDFTGWYTNASCTNKYDFTNQVTNSFTLYAGWEAVIYIIIFDANGGSLTSSASQSVSHGNNITQPNRPSRNGYSFTGWYIDQDCTNKYDFANQVTSSFTLYANWEAINNTITFNANGGTLSSNTTQNVLSGNKITEPTNPTRNGYIFTGWYTDRDCTNKYNFINQVTSSFTLYSGWKKPEEYISFLFDSLEGEGPHDIILNCEVTYEMCNLLETKINESSVKVNLNLKNATGIKSINFAGCTRLTSIELPTSVTSIDDLAFFNCSGLTSVKIPTSVTSIGDRAFDGCTALTTIEIPTSVTSIGEYAFKDCSRLTSIEIPTSVTSIQKGTFYRCTGLTNIEIPISVTSIGECAFYNCRGLTNIEIPTSVTSFGEFTLFSGCSGLTSIEIPTSVTRIGDHAFAGCSRLTSIEIPTSVTSIGDSAFNGCTGLTNIKIPTSVTSIGEHAFHFCRGLTNIEIPTSVTSFGEFTLFEGCSGLTSIEIPTSVTRIGDSAFNGCTGLTSIEIPTSVTSIGDCAFRGCSGLTRITFMNIFGWYCKINSLEEEYISLDSPSNNAKYFTQGYYDCEWYKK